jgi:SAM-dependent methyltransferase
VLRPLWYLLQRVDRTIRWRATHLFERPMPEDGIRPLTQPEFEEMVTRFPYYNGRWGYMSAALDQAQALIRRHGLRTALELGAPVRPIIVGADVMDIKARPELDPTVPMTIHDATDAPWPVADKAYDLFLALQVFEHLRDRQREAFREVRRVARHAIISLPIDWDMEDPRNCHHQISNERALSWFAPVTPTRVIEGSGGKRRRLIYVFEDLPA